MLPGEFNQIKIVPDDGVVESIIESDDSKELKDSSVGEFAAPDASVVPESLEALSTAPTASTLEADALTAPATPAVDNEHVSEGCEKFSEPSTVAQPISQPAANDDTGYY